jgi:hypothetical protein
VINPIPDEQVPWLVALALAGVLWVVAVPLIARWLLKYPPLTLSLPVCVAAAGAAFYLDLPEGVPFVWLWFALPVVCTAVIGAACRVLRGS